MCVCVCLVFRCMLICTSKHTGFYLVTEHAVCARYHKNNDLEFLNCMSLGTSPRSWESLTPCEIYLLILNFSSIGYTSDFGVLFKILHNKSDVFGDSFALYVLREATSLVVRV